MICKYCGKESDNGSEICSVCRDMLGVEEPEEVSAAPEVEIPDVFQSESEEKPQKAKKPKKEKAPKEPKIPGEKKDLIPMIALIMCALCLIVAVSSLYSAAKMRSDLGEAINFANKTQAENIQKLEGRVAVLEKQLKEAEEAEKAAQEAELKNFKIISAPGDETRELGYMSQPDHYLFGFIVEGQVQSFKWEKQLADGSYVPVEFDENGKNPQFGISLLESIPDGFSKLIAEGLTAQSGGTYKCTAVNTFGEKLEASVKLNITQ